MSEYLIRRVPGGISVVRDGVQIELKVLSLFAKPPFDFGDRSDSTFNLRYAILFDCVGNDEALLSYQDFAGEYLQDGGKEITISSQMIIDFVQMRAASQIKAQDMKQWKKDVRRS